MAKISASDQIMPAEKLRPLLVVSKQEPVQAAIGLTGDGEGVMLLDKKAKPKKVLSMLRSIAGKEKVNLAGTSLRFGRAEVDPDYDSAVVRLFVNKDPPGAMRVKLTEVVKRIAYQKVEFVVDPSLEEEHEDEADAPAAARAPVPEAPPPPPAQPAGPDLHAVMAELAALMRRIPDVSGSDAVRKASLTRQAANIAAAIKTGDSETAQGGIAALRAAIEMERPAQPAEAPEEAAEKAQLADLVRRVLAAGANNPALKASLGKLAAEANAAIKGHDTAGAAALIARLRAALDGAATPKATPNGSVNGWKAARQAWLDANDAVNDQLNALRAAVIVRAKDEPDYAEALKEIADKGLNGVTGNQRVALMTALAALGDGSPGDLRGPGGTKAVQQIATFRNFIATSDQIRVCDANPFQVPVSIRATLSPALDGLASALGAAA
jgi:hypothetical protein